MFDGHRVCRPFVGKRRAAAIGRVLEQRPQEIARNRAYQAHGKRAQMPDGIGVFGAAFVVGQKRRSFDVDGNRRTSKIY